MQLKLPTVGVWYLVALWYLSACVAVTSSRAVLKATHMPFCLSALQFILSSVLSYTLLRWVLPWTTRGNYKPVLGAMPSDSPEFKLVRSIALTYTLGFVFTNVALGLCNASFAETVKSAEPISSLTLATLTRGEDSVSTAEWLTTLPIVVGVALSSYSDSSFHILGFLSAGLSNFMFSMRGLNTKQLRRLHGTPHGLDDMHLFYRISRFGATLVVPLALLFEGPKLLRLLFGHAGARHVHSTVATVIKPLLEPAAASVTTVTAAAAAAAAANSAALLNDPSAARALESVANATGGAGGAGGGEDMAFWSLVAVSLLNGVCYFTYNQTSFVVLGRVSFVTHATLNVMRRVCIIIATTFYFATPMTPTNVLGICLAISGFALFLYTKVHGATLPLPR